VKQIPINEASAKDLADFATANLGLEVNFRMGSAAIRAKMATTGYTKDYIEIEEAEPVAPAPVAEGAAPRKFVIIMIAAQETPGGSEPVPVSVNGRAMWIERSKPSRVPIEYYQALMNAVKYVYDPDPGPKGGLLPARAVTTYPVTLLADVAA